MLRRTADIVAVDEGPTLEVTVDDAPVVAAVGETVLSVLFALGEKAISRNDHGESVGAYCGMGICYCCLVEIDGLGKQRACQTVVREGMAISTRANVHDKEGL